MRRRGGIDRTTEHEKHDHSTVVEACLLLLHSAAVQAVHRSVKSAREGAFGLGESARIMLNFAKVATHCYGTLMWCISLPGALNSMLKVLSVFAVDLAAETRIPCWVPQFNYFDRLELAMAAPLVIAGACVVCGVAWEAWKRRS